MKEEEEVMSYELWNFPVPPFLKGVRGFQTMINEEEEIVMSYKLWNSRFPTFLKGVSGFQRMIKQLILDVCDEKK